MERFNELLEKRKKLEANIYEEEELIELSKQLPQEELDKIDPELLTYSASKRLDEILELIDRLRRVLNKDNKEDDDIGWVNGKIPFKKTRRPFK